MAGEKIPKIIIKEPGSDFHSEVKNYLVYTLKLEIKNLPKDPDKSFDEIVQKVKKRFPAMVDAPEEMFIRLFEQIQNR